MDVSPTCRMCLSSNESIDHVLCGCKRARLICDNIFNRCDWATIENANNFADRIMCLVELLSNEDFERVCIAF